MKKYDQELSLDEGYKEQFIEWLERARQTSNTQEDVARLTQYFNLNPHSLRLEPIDTATVGRIAKNRPQKHTRVYNLLRILGTFYLLEIISEKDIQKFLENYEIEIPKGDSWDNIWVKITEGIEEANQHNNNPISSASVSNSFGIKRKILLLSLFFAVSIVLTLMIWQIVGQRHSEIPLSCGESYLQTDPALLPDQGFSQFLPSSTTLGSGVLSEYIRSIGINHNGVWVGYAPQLGKLDRVSQLFVEEGHRYWKHHCLGIELAAGQNSNDFAFLDNDVFIATDGRGIGQYEGTGWRFYTMSDGLPSNTIYSFYIDKDDTLLATTYQGVVQFDNGRWQNIYEANLNQLGSSHVFSLLSDSTETVWFALLNHGISRHSTDKNWTSYFANDPNLRDIRGITLDDEGGVWFATDRGGVLRFIDDSWTNYNVANGNLPSDTVRDIERDKLGRIWAATEKGLVYTSDFGNTWAEHSSMEVLDIDFGCVGCVFDEDHMWLALKDQGIGHVRIPPLQSTIEFISVPTQVQLTPGQNYIFQVEVKVVDEQLTAIDGDSLRSSAPRDTFLYGAYPIIPVKNDVAPAASYIFTNVDNPIIAPDEPGVYQTTWRVWQGRRFVSEAITIEFEVLDN